MVFNCSRSQIKWYPQLILPQKVRFVNNQCKTLNKCQNKSTYHCKVHIEIENLKKFCKCLNIACAVFTQSR